MFDFLYQLSDLYVFLVLSALSLSLSTLFIFILKRLFLHKLRYRDNAVLGNIAGLIGLIYGILTGLLALYLLNNNNYAAEAAQKEGSTITNLYRDSRWLNDPTRTTIQASIKKYIHHVIEVEWPLMQKNKEVDGSSDFILEKITDTLRHYPIKNNSESVLMSDMLTSINNLYLARGERISMSQSELSPELWEVIIMGTILIIGINYLYRVNFFLHLVAVCSFSLMASCMLFLLVTLDRPFQGEFIIEPSALQSALTYIEKSSSSP